MLSCTLLIGSMLTLPNAQRDQRARLWLGIGFSAHESAQDERWWQRYQPQDYRVIDNALGNTTDFKNMVEALDHVGVLVYADVVFNHMANEAHLRSDYSTRAKL